MEWRGQKQSRNIEDRRSIGAGRGGAVGGLGLLAVLAIGYFLGIDVTPLLNDPGANPGQGGGELTKADQAAGEFVAVSLGYTETIWAKTFNDQLGRPYHPVTLVLFKGATQSSCGSASGATGPFYCPGDQKVYIDLSFWNELETQFKAAGDFAQAYVIAHEVGHHIQTITGTTMQVREAQARAVSDSRG